MAKPPKQPDATERTSVGVVIDRLRIKYLEKIPPYNPEEERTLPAHDARRACIAGLAVPWGYPDEPMPDEGGPQWSLNENERHRRDVLAAARQEKMSDEERLEEEERRQMIEEGRQEEAVERKAAEDADPTKIKGAPNKSFLEGAKDALSGKKTAKKTGKGKGGKEA